MDSQYLRRLGAQGHLRVKEALRKWDPIGVYGGDAEGPDDEYDAYAAPVVALLDAGAPREQIVGYLRRVCEVNIEIPFDQPRAEEIVEELLRFWPAWKLRLLELGSQHLDE